MISDFFKRFWLSIIQSVIVFVGSFTVTNKVESLSGTRWWLAVIFAAAVYFASIIEITIKPSLRDKRGFGKTVLEIVLIWFLPLMAGYSFGLYVR